ncbi:MAG TPA: alkaline phosphatase family protein, partial [Rhodopila sp.]|nr:alkaline phosphatase family protein [Rhodopila sp.]
MDIKHVVVLMLENRSFDSMLGMLRPADPSFDGLTGTEQNPFHASATSPARPVPVWKSPEMTPDAACIPTPDPGELFTDIHMQIHGLANAAAPTMAGFVDNYMRQPPDIGPRDPAAVM